MPAILNEAVPATTHSLDLEIQSTLQSAYKYTALIEAIYQHKLQEDLSIRLLKEALINRRQHETFLKIILVSLRKMIFLKLLLTLADVFLMWF